MVVVGAGAVSYERGTPVVWADAATSGTGIHYTDAQLLGYATRGLSPESQGRLPERHATRGLLPESQPISFLNTYNL